MPAPPHRGRTLSLPSISGRPPRCRGRVSAAVLASASIWAYSGTFSVPFLFDDSGTIATNLSIRNWRTALFPPTWTTAGGRPVLNFSLAVNYATSGAAVWSYHLLNLAIHICAGLVLFAILRRTLRPWAAPLAFSAALLWCLHPLQTESVTYVVQRAESLMGLFYLLTLYCFIRYAERGPSWAGAPAGPESGRKYWAGLSVLACLLGMATKEVMVSAPLIALLYDRTFLSGGFRLAWKRHWRVLLGLGGTWLILPFLVLSTGGRGGSAGFDRGVSWWDYLLTQPPAIARYLSLSIWPHPLVFYYGAQWMTQVWAILPAAVGVVGLLAATVCALFRPSLNARSLGFAGAWFFAILAPSSLIPINRQTAAEHRMYLALIPVVVVAVVGIYRWLGRAALPASLALAAALLLMTWRRNQDYRSALVLWTDTVAKCPDNPYARDNLAGELEDLPGRTGEAIAQCREALRLKPDDAEAHNNLANALRSEGRTREAISEYEAALRLKPGFAEADNNLGGVLEQTPGRLNDAITLLAAALRLKPGLAEAHNNLGNALKDEGRMREASAQYEEALRLNPAYADAHYNLGNILNARGRMREASAEYEAALHLNPAMADAHYHLGNILNTDGRTREAISQYEAALRLNPDNAVGHNNLADALKAEGRTTEAIAEYEEALRLRPNLAEAHYNLGNVWSKLPGRLSDAVAQLQEALRLKPDYAEAHYNLGLVLSGQGRRREAIAQYQEAVRLRPEYVEAHNNLGNELRADGCVGEAIEQYEAALRWMPAYAAPHFNLAIALLDLPGRTHEAVSHLETFLQLEPGNETARRILARIRPSQP
jgi:tetratricopeptide (TPR) repeat protein